MASYRPKYRSPYPEKRHRKEPTPRTLANEFFGDRGNEYIANTEGMEAEAQEPYIELVESQGWELGLRTVFIPIIRKARRELLHRTNLPEAERQRFVGFLYYLAVAFTKLYNTAGIEDMPEQLRKEFN